MKQEQAEKDSGGRITACTPEQRVKKVAALKQVARDAEVAYMANRGDPPLERQWKAAWEEYNKEWERVKDAPVIDAEAQQLKALLAVRDPKESLRQIRAAARDLRQMLRNDADKTAMAVALNNIIILTGALP